MSIFRSNVFRALAVAAPLALAVFVVLKANDWLAAKASVNAYTQTAVRLGLATEEGRREWVRINRLADGELQWTDHSLAAAFTAPDRAPECDRTEVLKHAMVLGATIADLPQKMSTETRTALETLITHGLASDEETTLMNAVWAATALKWDGIDKGLKRGSPAWNVWNERVNGVKMPERGAD